MISININLLDFNPENFRLMLEILGEFQGSAPSVSSPSAPALPSQEVKRPRGRPPGSALAAALALQDVPAPTGLEEDDLDCSGQSW